MTAPAKEKKKPSFIYAASTFVLVLAVVLGGYYFLGIGLEVMFLFSWLLVFPACMKLGCSYGELEQGAFEFIKKGMGPVLLSLVVGGTISTWIGAGTVPAIIYYGLCYLKPGNFLLVAFVLSLALSLACGTAWGTMGTIGIAMFAVGQSFQVPAALTVGAIFSGAFLGETCTPMSSTSNACAAITGVPIMKHCEKAGKLAAVSGIIAAALYLLLGRQFAGSALPEDYIAGLCTQLTANFEIDWYAFIPMIVLFALILRNVPAVFSMLISAIAAGFVAVFHQGMDLQSVVSAFWNGFVVTGEEGALLAALLSHGGVKSMFNTICTMIFTFGIIGAFNTVGLMEAIINPVFRNTRSPIRLTATTQLVAIVGNMLGTNTFSILMAGSLMTKAYEQAGVEKHNLSRDITAASTVLCPLIPWNVSGLYITGLFGIGSLAAVPFAFCAFLTPLFSYVFIARETNRKSP